jgi:hypothetical protein
VILIGSAASSAGDCLRRISMACGRQGTWAKSASEFVTALKNGEFELIVVDQVFADLNPQILSPLWKNCGGAIPIFSNFALTRMERIVEDCRAGLERREREHANARKFASQTLRNELTSPLTGILLSSELALAEPELPRSLKAKLQSVHELALEMKNRLESTA